MRRVGRVVCADAVTASLLAAALIGNFCAMYAWSSKTRLSGDRATVH